VRGGNEIRKSYFAGLQRILISPTKDPKKAIGTESIRRICIVYPPGKVDPSRFRLPLTKTVAHTRFYYAVVSADKSYVQIKVIGRLIAIITIQKLCTLTYMYMPTPSDTGYLKNA
jgi:hypothetical protein